MLIRIVMLRIKGNQMKILSQELAAYKSYMEKRNKAATGLYRKYSTPDKDTSYSTQPVA